MRIKGKVLRLGNGVDTQGDMFSLDCGFEYPGGEPVGLPCWFCADTRVRVGTVEAIWFEGRDMWATVRVEDRFRVPLAMAKAVVPILGLCLKGVAKKERKEIEGQVVQEVAVDGLLLGINVDLGLPERGFVMEDPRFEFSLSGALERP
jgi:hypothetical protein